MGFSFRKSIGAGPFRLNLSGRGAGLSFGARGARVGISSRGKGYVSMGMGGFYYRSSLGARRRTSKRQALPVQASQSPQRAEGIEVADIREVESGDVANMSPISAREMIAELSRRRNLFPWFKLVGWLGAGLTLIAAFDSGVAVLITGTVALAVFVVLFVWHLQRRSYKIHYAMESEFSEAYARLIDSFASMGRNGAVWHIGHTGRIVNSNRFAGAKEATFRERIVVAMAVPPGMRLNVVPPSLAAGRQRLYFLPDVLMVFDRNRVGAVEYQYLSVRVSPTRSIEHMPPPLNSKQVGVTWKYVKKDGGPDRRFRDNHQVRIMEYYEISVSSPSGLNEVFQASSEVGANRVRDAISALGRLCEAASQRSQAGMRPSNQVEQRTNPNLSPRRKQPRPAH